MEHLLTQIDIAEIEATMTDEQITFVNRHIKKTMYDDMMGKLVSKGKISKLINVDAEDLYLLADQYEIIDVLEAEGSQTFQCDEGHKGLKKLFVVKNVEDGKIIHLGSTCLENLTGMSASVFRALIKIFNGIDLEYEELLFKFRSKDIHNQDEYADFEELPLTMRKQMALGLPLTDLQQSKVDVMRAVYRERQEQEQRRLEKERHKAEVRQRVLSNFNGQQLAYFEEQNEKERTFIVQHYFDRRVAVESLDVPLEKLPVDIGEKLKLEMPLNFSERAQVASRNSRFKKQKTASVTYKSVIDKTDRRSYVVDERPMTTYNAIMNGYGDALAVIKERRSDVEKKCPNSFKRLVEKMDRAKNGASIPLREIKGEIDSILRAIDIDV